MATLPNGSSVVLTSQSAAREKPLPKTLRDLRHARGWTLDHAATFAGVHKARLSELERGERPPSPTELLVLSEMYDVHGLRVVLAIVEDVPA